MKNGFKVIDGDGHMQEPMDMWENYTEPAFKERIPKVSGHVGRSAFSYAPCEIFPEGKARMIISLLTLKSLTNVKPLKVCSDARHR